MVKEPFDRVLLAAGQLPAVYGLGLEDIGVHYTSEGIQTDAALRTSVPHIWAAGDVRAGTLELSQIASSEGQLVARNALSGKVTELGERVVPYLIGLTPPVAAVGLTEEEARNAGYTVGVHRQTYREVCPAGNVVGEPEGFLKVVFDATSGKLLGAHAFGSGSPELVQQIAFAMLGGLTLRQAEQPCTRSPVCPRWSGCVATASRRSCLACTGHSWPDQLIICWPGHAKGREKWMHRRSSPWLHPTGETWENRDVLPRFARGCRWVHTSVKSNIMLNNAVLAADRLLQGRYPGRFEQTVPAGTHQRSS